MRFHIHRRGFDRVTGVAWLLCFPKDDDSGVEHSTSRSTFLLSRRSPNVIVRPGYDPPQIFKRTAKGWVECENESRVDEFGELLTRTSKTSRPIGEDEELDYLQVALQSVLPDSLLVSFHHHCVTGRSHVYRTFKKIMSKYCPNQIKNRDIDGSYAMRSLSI